MLTSRTSGQSVHSLSTLSAGAEDSNVNQMSGLSCLANYRTLYRTYRKTSRHANPPIPLPIRSQLRSLIDAGLKDHQLESVTQYLVSSNLHQVGRNLSVVIILLTISTEPERLKATVNRVGLNMPKALDLNTPLK
ncbi:hypothetical protein H4Q26_004302 [Puccinia striiformis f. sp. tritici PST-130]|nr:hypothetical protein H4Q26_004302 [Puccinia striiformis f. sp. tritici PST-130]